jgi:hypothetical protein
MGRRSRPRARQSRSAAPQVSRVDACMKVSFSRNQERRYARQPRNSNLAGAATATAITRCARPPPPGGASYRISLGFSYLGPCLSSAAFGANLLRLVQAAAPGAAASITNVTCQSLPAGALPTGTLVLTQSPSVASLDASTITAFRQLGLQGLRPSRPNLTARAAQALSCGVATTSAVTVQLSIQAPTSASSQQQRVTGKPPAGGAVSGDDASLLHKSLGPPPTKKTSAQALPPQKSSAALVQPGGRGRSAKPPATKPRKPPPAVKVRSLRLQLPDWQQAPSGLRSSSRSSRLPPKSRPVAAGYFTLAPRPPAAAFPNATAAAGVPAAIRPRAAEQDAILSALASSCLVQSAASAGAVVSAGQYAGGAPLPVCTVQLSLPPNPPSPPPCNAPPPPPGAASCQRRYSP